MSLWDRLLRSRRVTGEVRDEIRAHLDERVDDLVEAGVPEAEAYRRARIELGNATRAIEDSRGVWTSRVLDRLASDLRWTWRGLRARRGRAVLSIALLAIALAANTIVFAVADSLVFDRVPYPNAARLVTLQRIKPGQDRWPDESLKADALDEWRRQTDLFQSVDGYLSGTTFLLGGDTAERLPMMSVTVGLFDALGVRPSWGRGFVPDDAQRIDEQAVVLSETLARRRFGSPTAAIGQIVQTAAQPLRVIGVMPASFTFPRGDVDIWRALDPRGPLARNYAGVSSIARMRQGLSLDRLNRVLENRGPTVAAAIGRPSEPPGAVTRVERFGAIAGANDHVRLLYVLLGASCCLLLIACTNVVSLELTTAIGRMRTMAVQAVLGATRAALIRVACLEGVVIVAIATGAAWALTTLGVSTMTSVLPTSLRNMSVHPIAADTRVLAVLCAVAAGVWLIVALPSAVYASRLDLTTPLSRANRTTTSARAGIWIRSSVTTAQMALAIVLVIVGGLYVRTYQRLVALPKGFDSANLAGISMALPRSFYPSYANIRALADAVVDRLRRLPNVIDAVDGPIPPSTGDSPTRDLKIAPDGRSAVGSDMALAITDVDARYLSVLHVRLRDGRWLTRDDDPAAVVIGESFAHQYWPNGDAVGHGFRVEPSSGSMYSLNYRIVGVFTDYRTTDRGEPSPIGNELHAYSARRPPPPAPSAPPRVGIDTGGSYGFIDVLVRLDAPASADAVLTAARAIDPRVKMELEFIDDAYADRHVETLLATRVIGLFGVGAFVMAMAGLYGVMAFLVAGRTREIGIRMALGADRARIGRFVMGSSLRLVFVGAAIGIVAAVLVSRAIASQLFGVTPTDPATYITVAIVTVVVASLATWQPARRAARVDPVQTLRAE